MTNLPQGWPTPEHLEISAIMPVYEALKTLSGAARARVIDHVLGMLECNPVSDDHDRQD